MERKRFTQENDKLMKEDTDMKNEQLEENLQRLHEVYNLN